MAKKSPSSTKLTRQPTAKPKTPTTSGTTGSGSGTKLPFGGKRAAPFKKGGGRKAAPVKKGGK